MYTKAKIKIKYQTCEEEEELTCAWAAAAITEEKYNKLCQVKKDKLVYNFWIDI